MKLKDKIKTFPDSPGVYSMKNSAGETIYIGKAASLKERVRSYFSGLVPAKTAVQMGEVKDIDFIETESSVEALFLEARLIKKNMPKYNIKDKDDKSRIYVHITRERFPRVYLMRETDLPQIKEKTPIIYGPFLSGRSVSDALELIRKIVPFRTCSVMPKRKCLYGYLDLCETPCEGNVSKLQYGKKIRQVRDFFEGKKVRVLNSLKREMKLASKGQDFEGAAKVRDHIYALEHLKQMFVREGRGGTVFRRIEGYDISNISGAFATGSMVVFIDGMSEKSEYRKFKIKWVKGANDVAMMKEVLIRRFHNDWPHPDLILIDGGRGQVNAAVSVLKNLGLDIPVIGLAKGPDRKKDELITSRTLPRQDISLFKEVRDESHRFAKGYYERLHRKSIA
ncbi:MAG: GIY-YIG nuclease family protein [Candidatus Berkelbacteria bacterium]|nr:GIY-YIG nuclease family protein [Candidatus Berkelbacteria bacterium]